jgi:hypothetical protein
MSKKKTKTYQKLQELPKNRAEIIAKKPFSWLKFGVKIALLAVVIIVVVKITDSKNYFRGDKSNEHIERHWRSFYKFTRTKNIDVLLCGTSHVFCGLDPFVLSCALGCNCFVLATNSVPIPDTYFVLEETLEKTKPKLVVIETFGINGVDIINPDFGNQVRHFDACNDFGYKLEMTPALFVGDEYVKAWSSTIRNHSFLLTNREQIDFNRKNPNLKNESRGLDLGRFARFNEGIQPETLAKYDSLGSPVDGSKFEISQRNKKYLAKIVNLCKEKKIPVLFLTIPMYYKHISDYEHWHKELGQEFAKYPQAKWIDWQMPYDTTAFTPECFENTYETNQHLSNYGMMVTAYKFASILKEGNPYNLPDRSNEKKWLNDFSNQPHFIYNQAMPAGMNNCYQVTKEQQIGDFKIKEMLVQQNRDYNQILLKIEKKDNLASNLNATLLGEYQNKKMLFPIQMQKIQGVNPIGFDVYTTSIGKDIKVEQIMNIQSNIYKY